MSHQGGVAAAADGQLPPLSGRPSTPDSTQSPAHDFAFFEWNYRPPELGRSRRATAPAALLRAGLRHEGAPALRAAQFLDDAATADTPKAAQSPSCNDASTAEKLAYLMVPSLCRSQIERQYSGAAAAALFPDLFPQVPVGEDAFCEERQAAPLRRRVSQGDGSQRPHFKWRRTARGQQTPEDSRITERAKSAGATSSRARDVGCLNKQGISTASSTTTSLSQSPALPAQLERSRKATSLESLASSLDSAPPRRQRTAPVTGSGRTPLSATPESTILNPSFTHHARSRNEQTNPAVIPHQQSPPPQDNTRELRRGSSDGCDLRPSLPFSQGRSSGVKFWTRVTSGILR